MRCIDRAGRELSAYAPPTGLFRFLYDCAAGRPVLRCMTRPWLSRLVGRLLDRRISRCLIGPFVRRCGIDMSEYEAGPFSCFNAFFCRRLLPGLRPLPEAEGAVASPCDGKAQVFSIDDGAVFTVKGIRYTMEQLLRDPALAERYRGGTLLLLRLSVDDYHRYAYPVDGVAGEPVHLDGVLHTVDPFAAERRPIYRENIREYTLLETRNCGNVLIMEIGALLVGRIVNDRRPGAVRQGEEKGHFEYGASSIILCFERDCFCPDADLWEHTAAGCETRVKQGERLGCAALCTAGKKT